MNRTKLKNYAPQARRDFIQAVTDRAAHFGLTATKVEPVKEKGDSVLIGGKAFPGKVGEQRRRLEERVRQHGFNQTMEALAYTWFNRLVAIRFMELHDYLENGEGGASYRVLSNPDKDRPTPEILEKAEHVTLESLDRQKVIDLKLDGTREVDLYRLLLIAECNALNSAMPFLFEKIDDETELVLSDNLLHSDSLISKLVNEIDEEDWQQVEIIGWLYQFYISEKKDEVIGKVVASEDIPAATQLFTPNWIVKYLVQNTLGRQWLATYPQSALRQQMAFFIEPAEQTPEVQEQLKTITPTSLNLEEITLLDPACGSGHILVEAYDLFKAIYQERGYRAKDIPRLILEKNLFGLEIDDRAAQLAALALMMKARADDRRIFQSEAQPNVMAMQSGLSLARLKQSIPEDSPDYKDFAYLHATYGDAKTFGSLIRPVYKPDVLHESFENELRMRVMEDLFSGDIATQTMALLRQHQLLTRTYNAVVANPPYMGSKYYSRTLKEFVTDTYKDAKADLYACFIQRNLTFAKPNAFVGMITIPNWMFLSSFEEVRRSLLEHQTIDSFIHSGRGVFGSDFGTCSFVLRNQNLPNYRGAFRRLFEKQGSVASNEELEQRFFNSHNYLGSSSAFHEIPGCQIAYWASDRIRRLFGKFPNIGDRAHKGLTTGDNSKFVRSWWEIEVYRMSLFGGKKWFPVTKGGPFRRWYGNFQEVLNYENDGYLMQFEAEQGINPGYSMKAKECFFVPGVTWSDVSIAYFSARLVPVGFIPMDTGPLVVSGNAILTLSTLNSAPALELFKIVSPAVHFSVGHVAEIPEPTTLPNELPGTELVNVAKADWDSFETSWDFQTLPIIRHRAITAQQSQDAADAECWLRFQRMKELEAENNRLFIQAYGLDGEVSPEVSDNQITLYRPDRAEDIKRLLSYAIGCIMGRYSLDSPGLIYAKSGNVGFDPSQYRILPADDDGIIPLLEADWGIRDDAANRIVEFISVAWPKEHLEENLRFIAESLGSTKNEYSRETIRRNLATGFYKDHLRWYKRRPIYWLFTSGKHRAFQCLVYLHRYHDGTLARMRTEYVIPLQSKIAARIEQLEGDKNKAGSTSHRKKLQKEQDDLKKQQAELFTFDEKLKHAADQKITLEMDDGVKMNYGKFSDLLAEVKTVTGGKEEE